MNHEGRAVADAPADGGPPSTRRVVAVRTLVILGILAAGLVLVDFALRPFVPFDLVGPSIARYDAYYGKSLKPSASRTVGYYGTRYRISMNSLGYRGPEPPADPRGAIVFLGDSMTLGVSVEDDQVFPEIIRQRLAEGPASRETPVINAAIAGSGQGRWVKFLERDAERFAPSLVVMQFCRNDFVDNHTKQLYELADDGSIRALPIPPQSRFRAIQERIESVPILPYSRIYAVVKNTVRPSNPPNAGAPPATRAETDDYDDLTFAITETCLRMCADRGWPVLGITAHMPPGGRLSRLDDLFRRYGFDLIAIPTSTERPDLYFPAPNDHWNPAGHEFVAERILESLNAERTTPPPGD